MAIASIFFTFWRFLQIITLIPTLGMLAYFVHGFVASNTLTPNYILVLFITSVLAAAWCIVTLFAYHRSSHSAFFVSFIDLCFIAAFIAGVYELRGIAHASCSNFTTGGFYVSLGPFGYFGRQSNSPWAVNVNKTCAMLKACFAFGIINCILFAFTSFLALLIHRRKRDAVVVKETHVRRHSSRRGGASRDRSRRSGSRRQYYV